MSGGLGRRSGGFGRIGFGRGFLLGVKGEGWGRGVVTLK